MEEIFGFHRAAFELLTNAQEWATEGRYTRQQKIDSYIKTKISHYTFGFAGNTATGTAAGSAGVGAGLSIGGSVATAAIGLKMLGHLVPVLTIPLALASIAKDHVARTILHAIQEKRRSAIMEQGAATPGQMMEMATLQKLTIEDLVGHIVDAINKLKTASDEVKKSMDATDVNCRACLKLARDVYYYDHRVKRLRYYLGFLEEWTKEVQRIIALSDDKFNEFEKKLEENVNAFFNPPYEGYHKTHCAQHECYFNRG